MTSSARSNPQPQPLAENAGPRQSTIRDLYALVAFYLENPEFPLPSQLTVIAEAPIETVEAIAAERGLRVYGDVPQTDFAIDGTSRYVCMVVTSPREARPL